MVARRPVYAARDGAGNIAAVKILHPEMSLRHDVRERFLREGYVANKVAHPGAVQVLEHSTDESGSTFLVMELLEGQPARFCARRRRPDSPVPELVEYLDHIFDVLGARTRAGNHPPRPEARQPVRHAARAGVKILDFGLARMLDDVPRRLQDAHRHGARHPALHGARAGTRPTAARSTAGRICSRSVRRLFRLVLAGRKVHEAD